MSELVETSWRQLFRGAVREALAAVNSVARIGTQDTHAWERPVRYVADDNEGNVALVEFSSDGAVGVMSAHAGERSFDWSRFVALAPSAVMGDLARICQLPLVLSEGISDVFWTAGECIQSSGDVSWVETVGMLFEQELMSNEAWEQNGYKYYDVSMDVARIAVDIANRAIVGLPLAKLSENELRLLVPKGSKHEAAAIELLTSEGLFEDISVSGASYD